jgi:hypothetical protein
VRKLTTTILLTLFSLTVVAQITSENLSPTDTLKAYYDAAKNKDIDTAKKYLSHGTLQIMGDIAKAQGKTLDQMFKENADKDSQMQTPEFSNEKIESDTATVDIKAPNQPTITMPLVKEDGMWKLAIDKLMNPPPSDSKPAESPSSESVAVPECDDYLAKLEACLKNIPAAPREQYDKAIETYKKAWRDTVATPQGKASLATACKQATEMARTAMKSYNCEF